MKDALLTTTAATTVEIWFQDEARVGQQGSIYLCLGTDRFAPTNGAR